MDRRQFLTGVAAVTAAAALPAVATAAAHVAAPKAEWLPILDSTGKVCAREALTALVSGGKAWDPKRGIAEAVNGEVILPSGEYVFRGGPLDLTFIKNANSLTVRDSVFRFPDDGGAGSRPLVMFTNAECDDAIYNVGWLQSGHADITYESMTVRPLSRDAAIRLPA